MSKILKLHVFNLNNEKLNQCLYKDTTNKKVNFPLR